MTLTSYVSFVSFEHKAELLKVWLIMSSVLNNVKTAAIKHIWVGETQKCFSRQIIL